MRPALPQTAKWFRKLPVCQYCRVRQGIGELMNSHNSVLGVACEKCGKWAVEESARSDKSLLP